MSVAINVAQIPPFDPHTEPSTTAERWKKWVQNFDRWQVRQAVPMTIIQQVSVQDIFDTFAAPDTTCDDAKCAPKINVPNNRHMFHRAAQTDGESVDQFVTRLRQLAVSCEYDNKVEEYIRDQVIDKCNSDPLRMKLLAAGKDLPLDKVIEIAQTRESSARQAKEMARGPASSTVYAAFERPTTTRRPTGGQSLASGWQHAPTAIG